MRGGSLRMSLTITSTTADASWPIEPSCRHANMAGRIDAPAKNEFRSVFLFFKQKVDLRKTIIATVYCKTLRQLRRAILTSGVVFIHDNACPQSAVLTQQFSGAV
ncbi:hypothetical protein AVEN_76866-1 [Araneus ventricosus]|uniref:Uncharacterized protein n=1 Tax=Araneus ventricosus TaxID=182803 RepID=A0A4Y2RLK9_ARAVE|nr:hypothetical protein AVEN_99976-1 [Araneus ventricosus]GBN76249.1 hypothetical protein AVEN_252691-1 [Araneus ventricosus]GBN76573.1 hypothetical protein AVEN_38069-1 [Araneus ventricosus]GBN76664.1 hypothetical protein AVEN_76866-1 [Araneus ventricosus]